MKKVLKLLFGNLHSFQFHIHFFTDLISSRLEGKIVNGSVVEDGNTFSLVVSVKYKPRHTCGGYLIAGSHVLTAGHCVADIYYKNRPNYIGDIYNECFLYEVNRFVNRFTVYVGSINRETGGKLYQVIHMEFHPDLHPLSQGYPHDIALLTVSWHKENIFIWDSLIDDKT